MISVSKKTKYALGFLGVSLLLAIIIAEWQFNALRTAPPADGSAYVDGANVVVVVQPGRAPHFIQSLAREVSGYSIPMWILNASMPHEIGMSFVEHEDNGEVGIQVYGSLKRFGNTILSMDALSPLNSLEDRINWKPDEMTSPRRGLLLATGSVESDADALDAPFMRCDALTLCSAHASSSSSWCAVCSSASHCLPRPCVGCPSPPCSDSTCKVVDRCL